MTIVDRPQVATTFLAGAMTGPGEIELVTVPVREPDYGEALIRIEATAICTWEQRSFSGVQSNRFPFIGGHEIVGVIAALGPGYRGPLEVGDRVALGGSACGSCHWCQTGQDRACPQHYSGAVAYEQGWGPGGFAEYKIHPSDGLAPVGDAPAEIACLTEPLSCAVHASRLAGIGLGSEVVVIGAGVMGLMNVIAAKRRGARVIVSEVDADRLALARRIGADEIVDASRVDPIERVQELTGGRGADVAIAAIGHRSANEQGIAMLAQRGALVLFASAHPETPLELSPNMLHGNERRVIGSVSSEKQDFAAAAWLICHGQVDLSPLVQSRYPLSRLREALEEAILPGTYRIVVEP